MSRYIYVCVSGYLLATPLHSHVAFIGIFITDEGYRRKGIGAALMRHVLGTLHGRNVLLNAVEGTQTMYSNFGFTQSELVTVNIYIDCATPMCDFTGPENLLVKRISGKDELVEAIREYDEAVSTLDRHDYMPQWLLAPNSVCYVAVRGVKCVGYGAIRDDGDFYKVQPLYADLPEVATSLMQALLSCEEFRPQSLVRFRALVQNQDESLQVAARFGATERRASTKEYRMYTLKDIELPHHKVYSMANTENTLV